MAANFGFTPDERAGSYFISYNSEDADRVAPIVRELHNQGVPVWYDYGLVYGLLWEVQITQHISQCTSVILFATKKLFQRENGSYVRTEYDLAIKRFHKKVIIAMMDKIRAETIQPKRASPGLT